MNPLTYLKIGGVLFIMGICTAGYYYVSKLQSDVIKLSSANAKYELVLQEVNESMQLMDKQREDAEVRLNLLYDEMQENRTIVDTFEKKLSKHDLRKIIQRKPQLFEKIAQKGTDQYYIELKEISEWKNP
jgi:hypothetical protein